MIPTEVECKEIINEFKSKKVDVVETIKNTVKSEMISKDYFVATSDAYPLYESIPEVEFGSDEYFNHINTILNGGDDYYYGVYIALCFISPEAYEGGKTEDDGVFGSGLDTYKTHVDVELSEKDLLGDEESNFGVFIGKDEEYFCWKGDLGGHYGCTRLMNIEDYLEEPLHRLAVKYVYDAIIFK